MEATLTQTLPPLVSKLRSLHVHWNSCITDAFLLWVGKTLPRLEVSVAGNIISIVSRMTIYCSISSSGLSVW